MSNYQYNYRFKQNLSSREDFPPLPSPRSKWVYPVGPWVKTWYLDFTCKIKEVDGIFTSINDFLRESYGISDSTTVSLRKLLRSLNEFITKQDDNYKSLQLEFTQKDETHQKKLTDQQQKNSQLQETHTNQLQEINHTHKLELDKLTCQIEELRQDHTHQDKAQQSHLLDLQQENKLLQESHIKKLDEIASSHSLEMATLNSQIELLQKELAQGADVHQTELQVQIQENINLRENNKKQLEDIANKHSTELDKLQFQINVLQQKLSEQSSIYQTKLETTLGEHQVLQETYKKYLEENEQKYLEEIEAFKIQINILHQEKTTVLQKFAENTDNVNQELLQAKETISSHLHLQYQLESLQIKHSDTTKSYQDQINSLHQALQDANEKLLNASSASAQLSSELTTQDSSFNASVSSKLSNSLSPDFNSQLSSENNHIVLVFPTNTTKDKNIRQFLENNIKPSNLRIEVSGLQPLNKGGALIKCSTLAHAQTLQKELKTRFTNNLEVKIPKKHRPRIIIHNVSDQYTKEDIQLAFEQQNHNIKAFLDTLPFDEDKHSAYKIIFSIPSKTPGKLHWVVELDPNIYKIIQQNDNKLYIQWERLKTSEFLRVSRCSHCSRLGHTAKFCREKHIICSSCAGNHHYKLCTSNQKHCVNCAHQNATRIGALQTDHSSFDLSCPSFKSALNRLRARIEYL